MKITLLGSSSSLSTAERDNTYMVMEIQGEILLIDCGGSPVQKLLKLGLDVSALDNILLTHWHEDHIYGLGSLLHELLLLGRKRKIMLFLPVTSLRFVKQFLDALFGEEDGMYQIEYHPLELTENLFVLGGQKYEVYSTPVVHAGGTIAYKFIEKAKSIMGDKSHTFVYSSDTKPCDSLVRFAHKADLLIHECTYLDGEEEALRTAHTTARQVGEIAAAAKVRKLGLVHLGREAQKNLKKVMSQASEKYPGNIVIGNDFLVFSV